VPLELLQKSWWVGFNGIYLVRYGFRMQEILILKWFLLLKIPKNQVLGGKISWGCGQVHTWANGTCHTSHYYIQVHMFQNQKVDLWMGGGHRHPWPPIRFDVHNKGEAYGRASGSWKVHNTRKGKAWNQLLWLSYLKPLISMVNGIQEHRRCTCKFHG